MAESNPDIMSFSADEFGLTDEDLAMAEEESEQRRKREREILRSYMPSKPKKVAKKIAKPAVKVTVVEEPPIVQEKPKKRKKTRRRTSREIREAVIRRDVCCTVCGEKENLEVHHIVYRSKGGTDDMENLVTLCRACHAEKHKGEPIYKLMSKSVNRST